MSDEQFEKLITEIRRAGVIAGVIAKRGPADGTGKPALGLVAFVDRFVEAIEASEDD